MFWCFEDLIFLNFAQFFPFTNSKTELLFFRLSTQTIHQLFKVKMKAPVMKPRSHGCQLLNFGSSLLSSQKIQNHLEPVSIWASWFNSSQSTVAGTWWPAPFWSCWIRTWRSLRPCRDLEKCHQQKKKRTDETGLQLTSKNRTVWKIFASNWFKKGWKKGKWILILLDLLVY